MGLRRSDSRQRERRAAEKTVPPSKSLRTTWSQSGSVTSTAFCDKLHAAGNRITSLRIRGGVLWCVLPTEWKTSNDTVVRLSSLDPTAAHMIYHQTVRATPLELHRGKPDELMSSAVWTQERYAPLHSVWGFLSMITNRGSLFRWCVLVWAVIARLASGTNGWEGKSIFKLPDFYRSVLLNGWWDQKKVYLAFGWTGNFIDYNVQSCGQNLTSDKHEDKLYKLYPATGDPIVTFCHDNTVTQTHGVKACAAGNKPPANTCLWRRSITMTY